MAKKLDGEKNLCERELLEKILGIVEKQLQLPLPSKAGGCCLYDNKFRYGQTDSARSER